MRKKLLLGCVAGPLDFVLRHSAREAEFQSHGSLFVRARWAQWLGFARLVLWRPLHLCFRVRKKDSLGENDGELTSWRIRSNRGLLLPLHFHRYRLSPV